MERYRIFIVIPVGILFLTFSFLVGFGPGLFILVFLGMSHIDLGLVSMLLEILPTAGGFLGALIGLRLVIEKLRSFNKSYLKSLYIFIPTVILIIYFGLPPNYLISNLLYFTGLFVLIDYSVIILGCILYGLLFSRLLPSQKRVLPKIQ